jgi:non-reducing end alpha-L-arabinofuranosidase
MKNFGGLNRLNTLVIAAVSIMIQQDVSLAATCPCDIYAAANPSTPCVAAHSTVRLLREAYTGPLYQVRRSRDNTTQDIYPVSGGTAADAAAQDAFCSGTQCVITKVYDQSVRGNFLEYQGSGSSVGGQDQPAGATNESIYLSGHKVYSLYINAGNSYWRNGSSSGVPLGSAPEGMYMVTSGTHYNGGCCFDYGNSETNRAYSGGGTMDAIYFGTITSWGKGAGNGPWVMADLEGGIFAQNNFNANQNCPVQTSRYVTAVTKNNGTSEFAIRGGNAQSGGLGTYYKGVLPSGYNPMKKQGAIVLGSGGDCCATNTNQSAGTFYEGVIVSGYPSDATENSVQANIVAAGYGNTSRVTRQDAGEAAAAPLFKVNYNPSNGIAVISYALRDARRVSVNIFNQQGRRVAAIVNGVIPAGRHAAVWDAKRIPPGVYICRTAIDGRYEWAGKIVLEK